MNNGIMAASMAEVKRTLISGRYGGVGAEWRILAYILRSNALKYRIKKLFLPYLYLQSPEPCAFVFDLDDAHSADVRKRSHVRAAVSL